MKYGMPRLIDDRRRIRTILWCLGVAVLVAAAVSGYEVWFGARRADLKAWVKEADGILDRLDGSRNAGDAEALERARVILEGIASRAAEEIPGVPELALDAEMYIAEDRERVRRLVKDHAAAAAECAQGGKAMRETAVQAGTGADTATQLLAGGGDEAEMTVLNGLKAYRNELAELARTMFPGSRETEIAKSRFTEAQANVADAFPLATTARRTETVRQVLADADKIAERAKAAERQIREAMDRVSAIREEAATLRIDHHSGKFAELQGRLQASAKEVKDARNALAAAEKAAREERMRIQDKAEKDCREAVASIKTLVEAHGSLLPVARLADASEASKELKERISQNNAAWERQSNQISALLLRADKLCNEAVLIDGQLAAVPKTGIGALDAGRAATLPGELAEVRGNLVAVTAALDTGGLRRELEEIAGRVQSALNSVRAGIPDMKRIVGEIHYSAKTAAGELERASAERTALSGTVEAGRGSGKESLLRALAACTPPVDAANELARLESEVASNGKQCLALQVRLDKAKAAVADFSTKIGRIRQALDGARANGQFMPESWEAGVIGWSPENPKATRVMNGSVLVPDGALAVRQYEWEFDLEFEQAGEHRIEVCVSKPEDRQPVNSSIERSKTYTQERRHARGGFIQVGGILTAGGRSWRDDDPLWIDNYSAIPPGKAEMVVVGSTWFKAGHQTVRFRMELDTNPPEARNAAGDAWHPELLEFSVLLDGKPLRQFQHRAR